MYDLNISFQDENWIKIQTSRGIETELYEFFTFKTPGWRFDPRVKRGLWDGNLHLFRLKEKTIYRGLLPDVIQFCKDRGYAYNLESQHCPDLDYSLVDYINNDLIEDKSIREDQRKAIDHALANHRSIVVSPTAGGKSLILYVLSLFYLLNNQRRILIIVPTTSLVEQMYKDFIDYHKGDKEEFAKTLQKISGEYKKQVRQDSKIVVSTWQSIWKNDPDFFQQFDVILGDETHKFKSKCLTEIILKSGDVKFRHGVTATLSNKDSQVHILVLRGLFGVPMQVATTKELMDKGILSNLVIHAFRIRYADKKFCKATEKISFQEEVKLISKVQLRNLLIQKLALNATGNVMIMFQLTEQGKQIFRELQESETTKDLFYIDGSTNVQERERIREFMETKDNCILVASFGTYSTGINLKRLHHIIFHTAFKAAITMKQAIGRGLRLHETKDKINIYDFGDDFSARGSSNMTFNHFKERIRLYKQERFNIKLHEYKIEQGRITKADASTKKS